MLAASASTIAMMGATSSFAFFDSVQVTAKSKATGTQTITSVSGNTTGIVQIGGFGNQKAKSNNTATSTVIAGQNVQSANVIIISQ